MGIKSFFMNLKDNWRMASTADKISIIVDAVCGVGSACIGITAGKKLSEGKNIAERVCVKTVCTGLSIAAGDIASKTIRDNYVDPVAALIDRAKGKASEKKESSANE